MRKNFGIQNNENGIICLLHIVAFQQNLYISGYAPKIAIFHSEN